MELSKLNVGQIAFYAQDDWSVNDDFKLTIGLRADKPLYFNTSDLIQKYIDTDGMLQEIIILIILILKMVNRLN
jgi:outer membrane receptor protein involved in Fe transport